MQQAEALIASLQDVVSVRITATETGAVEAVHVLVTGGTPAKQVVRDVQSVALASFGIEVDRRIVSVVQLGGQPGGVPTQDLENPVRAEERAVLRHVNAEANGLRSLVRVTLAHGDREAVGFAEGSVASSARHRLVAAATLDALRQVQPAAECCDVDAAQILRVGAEDVGERDPRPRRAERGEGRVFRGDDGRLAAVLSGPGEAARGDGGRDAVFVWRLQQRGGGGLGRGRRPGPGDRRLAG